MRQLLEEGCGEFRQPPGDGIRQVFAIPGSREDLPEVRLVNQSGDPTQTVQRRLEDPGGVSGNYLAQLAVALFQPGDPAGSAVLRQHLLNGGDLPRQITHQVLRIRGKQVHDFLQPFLNCRDQRSGRIQSGNLRE